MWVIAFFVGIFTLFRTVNQIDLGFLGAHAAFIYGIAGVSLVFCGAYIRNLEKIKTELMDSTQRLLENNEEMLAYLNGYDDDPDPDDGEKVAISFEEKPKAEVIAFRPKKQAS